MSKRPDPKLSRLRRKIGVNLHESKRHPGQARRYKKRIAYLQHLIAKSVAKRHGLDHEAILDGCPMPLGHKLMLLHARRHGWTGVVESADRREAIKHLLNKLGKQDQAELYYGWIHHLPGYYPANPPTMGTHIRIGDGTVGAVGEVLEWWQEGIDATESGQLRSILNKLGYAAYQPYKTESEYHHTNLRHNPKSTLIRWGKI